MAERIPEATLAEIRARTNIVEIISGYVALGKSGRNHIGLCPFHGEKTPSFSVNEERGFFHCFGCNESGNAFTFLSKIDGLTFPEAVRYLAQRAGVSLPDSQDPQSQERARLYRVNEMAAVYFQHCLTGKAGATARRYLEERGIKPDIVTQFRLGFAPPQSGGLVRFLSDQRADLNRAASIGLIGKRDSGGYYDRFRHRLMFPITDVVGRPVGFGGRILPQAEHTQRLQNTQNSSTMNEKNSQFPNARSARPLPKYINSSDSLLYKKGTLLYGLAQAKPTIQSCNRVLVVEGYVDLLAVVQHGHGEAVAVLGTALTAEQLKLVRRFTHEVYLFFDGDEAGLQAATRSFPLCVEAEVRGWGVFLPEGEDPDSFVRTQGLTALDELIAQAEPLEDFYFRRHTPPTGASAFERSRAARDAMAVLRPMKDIVARGALLSQIAERFGVGEEDLRRVDSALDESQGFSRRNFSRRSPYGRSSGAQMRTTRQQPQGRGTREIAPRRTVETELIFLMLIDHKLALRAADEEVIPAFQQWGALAAEILAGWHTSDPRGKPGPQPQIDIGVFLERLPKGLADRVSRAYGQEVSGEESEQREQLFRDCVRRIQTAQRKSVRERLQQEIREAEQRGDEAAVRLRLRQLQNWDASGGGRPR